MNELLLGFPIIANLFLFIEPQLQVHTAVLENIAKQIGTSIIAVLLQNWDREPVPLSPKKVFTLSLIYFRM